MKYDARTCHFNMDTGCVELLLRDGRMISIDCTGVEDALDVTMAQRSELDYLIYNDPLGYAELWAGAWIRGLKVKKQGAPLNEQRPICPTVFGLTNGVFYMSEKRKAYSGE